MKKNLKLAFLLLLVVLSATSCRDDSYDYEILTVNEYKTKKIEKGYSWKVFNEPSYDNAKTTLVEGETYLGKLYKIEVVDSVEWYCLQKTRDFYDDRYGRNWIPSSNVEKCGEGEILIEVESRAKMMEMADQPIAHAILSFKEQIREKYPLDDYAIDISIIYSLLIWVIFIIIRITHRVRVWHVIATMIVVALQYTMILTCDIFNLKGQIGDPILDFIVGFMWLLAPIAQIWVMQALLSPILLGEEALATADSDYEDEEHLSVKGHFLATLLSVIVLFIIYYFNKDWVDGAIKFCGVVQLITFIIMWICNGLKRTLIYMPLFLIFALPTIFMALSSLVMTFAIFATLAILVSPILGEGGKVAKSISCKITNAYGLEIDRVDENGHSEQTGDNYDINSDGIARKK